MTLDERIQAAIKRIQNGMGNMRIPVDQTDPDIVLAACQDEIDSLRDKLSTSYMAHDKQIEALKDRINRLIRQQSNP